ncbi:Ig-like domain-containing protein, partial [Verminephrobacter aporrectodeae]|uniref:Ig-like domain-containing protein n=1 Tax=Verminephrobacter aporrectodeae TaxID=1110389 RepID=UPI002243E632
STTVTFTFNEPANNFDARDIVCPNGRLSALTENDERTVWTATFTPNANANARTNAIRVDLAGVTNDAGTAGIGRASSANYSVDTTRPTASITLADSALTAGESTTVTIRFSEPVEDFDASDIVYTNGTLSWPTANAERTVWTATFTPTANVTAQENTIRVNLAGVRDDAGNDGTDSAISSNYSVDTVRPTATITLADTALTAGESTSVSFHFNEPVTGLNASDVVCPNGTLSAPTANAERTVWTATFTPTVNVSAPANTIRLNLANVRDDAGNAGTGSADSANYSVDTRTDSPGPTATITLADSALTVGQSTTVSFRFNEPVTDFDASDVVCTSGTLSAPTANAERTVWTATFTPAAEVSARANTIRVNLAGVRDDAGNAGTGSASSDNYSVDTTRPTATITLADTVLTTGETTSVSFRFSEPVNHFDASDVVCTSGTLSAPMANAERTVWTATFTPTANTNARENTIRVSLSGVSDDAGNAGTGSASSDNYSVHTTRPTATITLADSVLTVGETTTVTITFNEPVNGFDASDIVCESGTLSWPTASDDRTVWTATFTPTANVSAPANTIHVNLASVTNDVGTAGTGNASSDNYSVDTKRPTATITLADSVLTVGETTTVTITFSEPVRTLDASDVVYTHGTLGWPTASDDRTVWTATFTPTANVSAPENTIRVNLAGVRDDAGNAGTDIVSSANYSVDTTRPTATITLADSALTAGESTTVSFTFNKPVNGLDASDILCTSGTLSAPAANAERTVWTATFTPTANVNAPANTIRVNLTGVRDDAGNAGTGSADSANYSVDTRTDRTGPTATIALADSALTAGETTTVSFTFNKPVNGFDASDVVYTHGTLSAPTANAERTVWTATFTPTANVSAEANTIRVNLSGVTDDAGNAGTGSADSANYSVDTRTDRTGPTATIALADSALTAGESTTVSFTFNKPVNDFDASDVVCTSGTLSAPTANAERTVWTATFTPTANVNAPTNTIRVNLSGVTDDAGNAGTGSAISANYSVDTRTDSTGPTATIALADSALTAGESTTVTVTFNKPVNDFDASDIVYTSGTLTTPTANAERTVWTATFTPTANVNVPTNTIRVNLAGVSDDAGNAGTGSAISANYSVDTTRPTATITLADNALTVGESTTVSFRFNKPVNGLDSSDIVLTDANGTLTAPTANAERTVWTATFTPTANANARENTIRVNLAGVTDDAGNAGTEIASSANYSVDTTRPTATITLADTALSAGESTTVTITFSEPIRNFDASDILYTNGTLSWPTASADRTVWMATFTPTVNVTAGANTIRVNLAGVRDDAGNAGTGSADSANYSVDTRPADTTGPTATLTLANTHLAVGDTTTVTIAFNEPVTGFTRDDLVLSEANGTLTDPTTNDDGRTWTATFTPTAGVENSSNTISVNLTGVRNVAGRAGTGHAPSAIYQIDTRAPVLASATVNVTQLVLRYTEGTSLDATHIPSATAFAVRVDNVLTAVTAIAVGAQEKTVNLTLATAVATGQAVSVAYTDPTTGNDANAVQDAAGNDAASFAATPVDNRTPAPPGPTPGPSPAPGPSPSPSPSPPEGPAPKDTKDTDGDSIPDSLEDQTPGLPGPDGAAPVAGDGNGDGVRDSTQAAVGSTSARVRSTAESAASTPVTLVAGSQDGKVDPDSGARITRLAQEDAPAPFPDGMEMPLGLLSFRATLATGRSSEKFSLYLDPALGVNGYWLKDSSGTWTNLSSAAYGGKMASEGGRLRLDFEISDGGPFDADGQANGAITAPGAPAQMPLSIMGQASDLASNGFWL